MQQPVPSQVTLDTIDRHSPAYFGNANSGYMGTWHASQTSILLTGFSPLGITLRGGHQGDAHVTHGWGMLIDRVESYLGWDGLLHAGWPGRTALGGGVGLVTQRAPRRKPLDDDDDDS